MKKRVLLLFHFNLRRLAVFRMEPKSILGREMTALISASFISLIVNVFKFRCWGLFSGAATEAEATAFKTVVAPMAVLEQRHLVYNF